MIIDDRMHEKAEELADKHFPDWKDEDGRWETFREILEGEAERQRQHAIHMLMLQELLDRLYPNLESANWRQFGWNDVLSGKLSADVFIHRVRMARAAGSKTGRL